MKPRAALLIVASLAFGCIRPPSTPTALPAGSASELTSYSSPKYADPKLWLCRPGDASDACHEDLSATEIRAEGSPVVRSHEPARAPSVDCFYVYPTVDLSPRPANHEDLAHTKAMGRAANAQVARFSEACNVYAPLYRQITIGAYLRDEATREPYFETAFSDVADAFLHYLAQWNHGRPIVLVGHSQGAEMVVRLLRKHFDSSPEMRARLLLAMPIGANVLVPPGSLVGGSFQNIPVCSSPDEKGCVISFQTHPAGETSQGAFLPLKPGFASACVNPASVGGRGAARFSRTYFPTPMRDLGVLDVARDAETPYVLYRGFFSGRCVEGKGGYNYLEVAWAPQDGDPRGAPLDLDDDWGGPLGTHLLDMQFTQGDLIDLVRRATPMRRELKH